MSDNFDLVLVIKPYGRYSLLTGSNEIKMKLLYLLRNKL